MEDTVVIGEEGTNAKVGTELAMVRARAKSIVLIIIAKVDEQVGNESE